MNDTTKFIAAALISASTGFMAGCSSPPMNGGGGYHSTSSAQNVGSRSSNGVFGGTSDPTGSADGTTGKSAPATPYSQNPPVVTPAEAPASNNAKIGSQNP